MPSATTLAEPLRSRWSPSIFDPHHVLTPKQTETLLHAAQWSPSYGNSQPTSFVVLPRGGAGHAVLVEHLTRGNSWWVPRASLVVLSAAQVRRDDDGRDVKDADFARYDLGQAMAHLTLQAQAMGLQAHQFAGYDRVAVAAALGVPSHVELMAAVAVGMPGDPVEAPEREQEREQRSRTRRPLDELAHAGRWGVPWTSGA